MQSHLQCDPQPGTQTTIQGSGPGSRCSLDNMDSMDRMRRMVPDVPVILENIMSIPSCLSSMLTEDFLQEVRRAAAAIADSELVHIVGCGTSYFAANAGVHMFRNFADMLAVAHDAFEFAAYPVPALERAALVAISHTGTTQAVLDALGVTKKSKGIIWRETTERSGRINDRQTVDNSGCVSDAAVMKNGESRLDVPLADVALTDAPDSALAKAAAHVLYDPAGVEPVLPKTRSYVTTLMKICLLASEVGNMRGRRPPGPEFAEVLQKLPDICDDVLETVSDTAERVARYVKPERPVFIVGAGPNFSTACEGALKLQECASVPGMAWEIEEAMHGPWVALEPGDVVVVLAMRGPALRKSLGFARAVEGLGLVRWIITDDAMNGKQTEASAESDSSFVTRLPHTGVEALTPIYAVLPLYLFACRVALMKGFDPDAMRLDDPRYAAVQKRLPR